jgi:hypothetical protein
MLELCNTWWDMGATRQMAYGVHPGAHQTMLSRVNWVTSPQLSRKTWLGGSDIREYACEGA